MTVGVLNHTARPDRVTGGAMQNQGPEEIFQKGRDRASKIGLEKVFAFPSEDQSSVPRTQIRQLTTVSKSNYRRSDELSWPPQMLTLVCMCVCSTHTNVRMSTCAYNLKILQKK